MRSLAFAVVIGASGCGGTAPIVSGSPYWLLQGQGAVGPVELAPDAPDARFAVQIQMVGDEAIATSQRVSVAITLVQSANLAVHTIDWPTRNQLCSPGMREDYCPRTTKWHDLTPSDGDCDGEGTCVAILDVTVTAVDAASLPEAPDLTLQVSGVWRGDAEDAGQRRSPLPPPDGTQLVFAIEPAP